MGRFERKVKGINSYANSTLPPVQTTLFSLTSKGARSFGILLILASSSCTKNPQQQPPAMHERDTVTGIQELRDSISGSSIRKSVAPDGVIPTDPKVQEKGSTLVDTLVGSVYVSGNEPFTRLTLALDDGRKGIFLKADSATSRQLLKLQGKVVRIFGRTVRSGTGDYVHVDEFVLVQ
jgi:hypothetical protein